LLLPFSALVFVVGDVELAQRERKTRGKCMKNLNFKRVKKSRKKYCY
jgi:hypothetical protein